MARSSDTGAGTSIWLYLAAAILALQGLTTIAYAGFLPAPISDAGVSVPLLGRLPFVWLGVGLVALVAAFGVVRRRIWGRYLGTVSEVLSAGAAVMVAPSLTNVVVALILPAIVVFLLWWRWPGPDLD